MARSTRIDDWSHTNCCAHLFITHVDFYDEILFNRAYEWMKARGMTEGQSQHGALVVG